MSKRIFLLGGLFTATAAGIVAAAAIQPPTPAPAAAPAVTGKASTLTVQEAHFFEAKVRPILAEKCYKCHSMETPKLKGGLLLDTREGWMKGGESGPAIIPHNAAKSRFILAITYKDADLQMPPKGDKLSDQQVADLTEWINMGAPDPRSIGTGAVAKLTGLTDKARAHWAYQPIVQPAIPDVKDKTWVKTPVDSFILAKLEANNMKPSKAASKEVLMRRAYYDLIGLPPSPEELAEFIHDKAPNAFEKVVDRLLASPHYGERWGRFWLDSARYADTTGAERARNQDYRYAYAWTYRDYVIHSFNSDKPYDLFLKEQLAADQLPDAAAHPETLAALGFLTVGKRFANVNDTVDERIDTICKSMLGMTVSCARCHDHKFDPIPQMDYYSLHGILTSMKEPEVKPLLGKPVSTADLAVYEKKMAALEAKNKEIYFNLIETKSAEFYKKAGPYILAKVLGMKNTSAMDIKEKGRITEEYKLDRGIEGKIQLRGDIFAPVHWFAEFDESDWKDRTKDYLDEMANGRRVIPNKYVREAFKGATPATIRSLKDIADIYGKLLTSLAPQSAAYIKACREAKGTTITGFDKEMVDLLQFAIKVEPAPLITSEHLRKIIPSLPLRNNQADNLFAFGEINELELLNPASPPRAMSVVDSSPHDDPVFIRGEAANHGPIAPRRFLQILSPKNRENFKHGSGRLELAENIASKTNPMTPRVMINRIWMHHFGDGFVRTPDDLGVQSEAPSHQELIDYLSAKFVEDGWSVKKIHKLIMLSSVYQQTADANPAYQTKDPANRLLWRANVRRLDFEAIRDSILLFTGNLDATIGGRPVNLTDEPYSYRRSIYGYIDRGNLPELLQQFDFSDPDRPNSHRTSTIVPQQALFFMNSAMAVDVARRVTSRPEFVAAGAEGRVRVLYSVLFQRQPQPREVGLAIQFFNAHDPAKVTAEVSSSSARKGPAPKKMTGRAKEGIQNEGEMVERTPLTLWQEYAQALLFTNEIAYVN